MSRSWSFSLNPDVIWQEVSTETKLRLKTLPDEAVSDEGGGRGVTGGGGQQGW